MFSKLEEIRRKYEEVRARLGDPEFVQDHRAVRDAQKTLAEFEPIIAKNEEHSRVARELAGARELVESLSPGEELYQMAASERTALTERLSELEQEERANLLHAVARRLALEVLREGGPSEVEAAVDAG